MDRPALFRAMWAIRQLGVSGAANIARGQRSPVPDGARIAL
jgi:hypothetical protein